MRPALALAVLLSIPMPASAHEGVGRNGGRVVEAGRYHVELVARDRRVEVYLLDAQEHPLSPAGFRARAVLTAGGRATRVALEPEGDRLAGRAETALPAEPKGAVLLTAPDGSTASGRFE